MSPLTLLVAAGSFFCFVFAFIYVILCCARGKTW